MTHVYENSDRFRQPKGITVYKTIIQNHFFSLRLNQRIFKYSLIPDFGVSTAIMLFRIYLPQVELWILAWKR